MSLSKKIQAKRQAKIREEKIKKAKTAAVGIAAGAAVGAVGGILLAPKAGKETREDIKNASKQAANAVSDKAVSAKSKAGDVLDSHKEKFNNSKAKIKEYLEARKAQDGCEECLEIAADVAEDDPVEEVKEDSLPESE